MDNQSFVQQAYKTYLGREADANGLKYYTDMMNSGTSAADIAKKLVVNASTNTGTADHSYVTRTGLAAAASGAPNATITAGTGFGTASATPTNAQKDYVKGVYKDYLGRDADADGLNYYSKMLAGGLSQSDVLSKIIANASTNEGSRDQAYLMRGDRSKGTAEPSYTRRDDSVVNSLMRLMSADSPLMRQAQTSGLQSANRRGLLNSSMAVQAAQGAAYNAAVPIASQEAAQAAKENLANLNASTQVNLAKLDTSTRLQLQQMSDSGQYSRLQATIGSTERQQQNEILYQTAMKQLDRGLQERLAKMNLDESQRASAAQSVLASQELYNNRINNIMANTNLSAEDRTTQLASAKSFFDIQMDLVQQMYDVSLKWQ